MENQNQLKQSSLVQEAVSGSTRHDFLEEAVRRNGPITSSMTPTRSHWCQLVDENLPSARLHPRIAIIGSVDFYHSDSPFLCDAIGAEIARRIPNACLLTGANAVVQERLSRAFVQENPQDKHNNGHVFHLAPAGYACEWEFGKFLEAGQDMEQRRYILSTLADVCISIEGGPGTVDEMNKAQWAGKTVLPVARTGGASNGFFEAPALPCPSFVEESTWAQLKDDQASIRDSATAVVDIVEAILKNRNSTDAEVIAGALDIQYSKRPSAAYAEPSLAGCAHLPFQGNAATVQ